MGNQATHTVSCGTSEMTFEIPEGWTRRVVVVVSATRREHEHSPTITIFREPLGGETLWAAAERHLEDVAACEGFVEAKKSQFRDVDGQLAADVRCEYETDGAHLVQVTTLTASDDTLTKIVATYNV